ncbi:MAG TPA: O-antigen ligase family protein [Ignavibacteria bacterium]|nr:O-antigen ligase family protein [Ignavibacteria bacterium]
MEGIAVSNIIKSFLKEIKINYKVILLFSSFFFLFDSIILQSVFYILIGSAILLESTKLEFRNIVIHDFIIWFLLLIWGGIAIGNSFSTYIGFMHYVCIILSPFFIFLIFNNLNIKKEYLNLFFDILIISGVILSIISIYVIIVSGFNLKLRLTSIWSHYNLLAAYLMILFMFCVSFLIHENKRSKKFFYSVSLFLIILGLFLTQTRGVWLSTIVSFGIFFIKRPKVIVPFISVLLIILVLFFDVINERVLTVVNFGKDVSSLGRLQAWMASWILFMENPIFGHGFDAFRNMMENVFPVYFVVVTHAHNTYLQILLELGLVGFLLYFSFFIKAFIYSFKYEKNEKSKDLQKFYDGLQLSFIGLIIAFIFEPYFTFLSAVTYLIWILISVSYLLRFRTL